jgi:hypothetical protein
MKVGRDLPGYLLGYGPFSLAVKAGRPDNRHVIRRRSPTGKPHRTPAGAALPLRASPDPRTADPPPGSAVRFSAACLRIATRATLGPGQVTIGRGGWRWG